MCDPAHDSRYDKENWEEVHREAYPFGVSCHGLSAFSIILALTHCTVDQSTDNWSADALNGDG